MRGPRRTLRRNPHPPSLCPLRTDPTRFAPARFGLHWSNLTRTCPAFTRLRRTCLNRPELTVYAYACPTQLVPDPSRLSTYMRLTDPTYTRIQFRHGTKLEFYRHDPIPTRSRTSQLVFYGLFIFSDWLRIRDCYSIRQGGGYCHGVTQRPTILLFRHVT
jgi:hypothetical protein